MSANAKAKAWPDRYIVTLSSIQGESTEYGVTSWQSQEKAIALAAAKHTQDGGTFIYRVDVKCLGPAPRAASGVAPTSLTEWNGEAHQQCVS
jgi:hypothetical protein